MKKTGILLFLSILSYATYGQRVKMNIVPDASFDQASIAKLNECIKLMDSIFNSKAFEDAIMAETFDVGNEGCTKEKILELIKTGKNLITSTESDYSIDMNLSVYNKYRGQGEFGSTVPKTNRTTTHRCYILQNNTKCYASHLVHEYMHEIGFLDVKSGSIFNRTKTNSVPYKIGRIFNRLIGNTVQCEAKNDTCTK